MSTEQDHKRHAFLMEHGLGNFYKLAPDHVGYITGATMEKLVDLALAAKPLQDEPWGWVVGGHLYRDKKVADQAAWITDAVGKPRPITPVYLATSAPAQQAGQLATSNDYELGKSIIHECPALKMPQTLTEKVGATRRIIALKGATDEDARLILAALVSPTHKQAAPPQPIAPLPPAALAAARAFGAGLDSQSLEQPSEVV